MIVIVLTSVIVLILLFVHKTEKNIKKIILDIDSEIKDLKDVQKKCTKETQITKTYNNREGQIYQLKKLKTTLQKL